MTKPVPSPNPGQPTNAPENAHVRGPDRSCEGCGRVFTPRRLGQRHCSGRCRATASRQREVDRLTALLQRLRPDDPGRPE